MDFKNIKRYLHRATLIVLAAIVCGTILLQFAIISKIHSKSDDEVTCNDLCNKRWTAQYTNNLTYQSGSSYLTGTFRRDFKKYIGDDVDYIRDVTGHCHRTLCEEHDILKWQKKTFLRQYKNPCYRSPDQKLLCLPYFMLVGAMKCGTTELYHRIFTHPDFVKPTIKENYWLSLKRIDYGSDLAFYADSNFSPLARKIENLTRSGNEEQTAALITGDATTQTFEGLGYWYLLGANKGLSEPVESDPDYIYHLNNQTKILINVRNPIERLWSEYLAFSISQNKSAEHFHELIKRQLDIYRYCLTNRTLRSCIYDKPLCMFAIMDEDDLARNEGQCSYPCLRLNSEGRLLLCRDPHFNFKAMLRRSVYHVFIKDYLRVFPRNQVLIQRLEDIRDKPVESLVKTYQFLGLRIPNMKTVNDTVHGKVWNRRRPENIKYREMLNTTRYMLHEFLKPHNEALALLLNDSTYNYGPFSKLWYECC